MSATRVSPSSSCEESEIVSSGNLTTSRFHFPRVRKLSEARAWRAMAVLADGGTGVSPEVVSSASRTMLSLVDSLVEHIGVLEKERQKLGNDLRESMEVMKRWRAREEIQQQKRHESER